MKSFSFILLGFGILLGSILTWFFMSSNNLPSEGAVAEGVFSEQHQEDPDEEAWDRSSEQGSAGLDSDEKSGDQAQAQDDLDAVKSDNRAESDPYRQEKGGSIQSTKTPENQKFRPEMVDAIPEAAKLTPKQREELKALAKDISNIYNNKDVTSEEEDIGDGRHLSKQELDEAKQDAEDQEEIEEEDLN